MGVGRLSDGVTKSGDKLLTTFKYMKGNKKFPEHSNQN